MTGLAQRQLLVALSDDAEGRRLDDVLRWLGVLMRLMVNPVMAVACLPSRPLLRRSSNSISSPRMAAMALSDVGTEVVMLEERVMAAVTRRQGELEE
ncbi:hypothetical protein M1D97_14835 [Kushneria sp. AK178]